MKKITRSVTFCAIALLLILNMSSCSMNNRLTSPETLQESEQVLQFGVVADPMAAGEDSEEIQGLFQYQPIFGYRTGLKNNQELGVTMYGVIYFGFVVDWKHQLYKQNNFIISGDLAAFTGLFRKSGLQYDLLFGNSKIYGTAGINYSLLRGDYSALINQPSMVLGVGTEFGKNSGFGVQLSYMQAFDVTYNYHPEHAENPFSTLSIGIKYDFKSTKKSHQPKI